jgi:exodeoxyribonuclease-3
MIHKDSPNSMRIATYNVNGINGRLANLLAWLEETAPDIVCLQELKAPDEKFPAAAICAAGYGAVSHGQKSWNGVAILARGVAPIETRRGLPGDPDDTHSRYIEAAIGDTIVGCLYLPNGNPAPGPKFDYKLRWFERLAQHAKNLLESGSASGARRRFCRVAANRSSSEALAVRLAGWLTR